MYIIKRDGLYLAGYQYSGIVEYDANGEVQQVPTGVYSANRRDAMMIKNRAFAESFGGEVIRVEDDIRSEQT